MADRRKTTFLLKRGIGDAVRSDGADMRPLVVSGNDIPGGRKRRTAIRPISRVRTVQENLLKIQQEADPIDFLIRVQRGELIPVQSVTDDGEVVTAYETAALADRIGVAKFMAAKVLPTLTVTQHLVSVQEAEAGGGGLPGGRSGASFAQLVAAAAARASPEVDGQVYEADEGEEVADDDDEGDAEEPTSDGGATPGGSG